MAILMKEEMKTFFNQLNKAYNENDFTTIFAHEYGIYFLKLRTFSRVELLRKFAKDLYKPVEYSKMKGKELFEFLFCQNIEAEKIDSFINDIYTEERNVRKCNEVNLYSQLYNLKVFNWGGFYQNAVERTIVNKYVKKVQGYEQLINSIDNNLAPNIKNYVLCSWYNHWTSIIIEDMIKDQECILPAVGLVKKVDFFWNNYPFDLKVTYFPDGFMKLKRKNSELPSELKILKDFAKKSNINYDKRASDDAIYNELLLRITESTNKNAKEFIKNLREQRKKIIKNTMDDPKELLKWLYENQGTRRFDAANRFFIILIDIQNLDESWKLKRNKELLENNINSYFERKSGKINFDDFKLEFEWEGSDYETFATCLFIIKE